MSSGEYEAGLTILLGKSPQVASDMLWLESKRERELVCSSVFFNLRAPLCDSIAHYDALLNWKQILGVACRVLEHR